MSRISKWWWTAFLLAVSATALYADENRFDLKYAKTFTYRGGRISVERPVTARLARLVERRRWGLVKRLGLPPPVEVARSDVALHFDLVDAGNLVAGMQEPVG